MSSSVRLGEQWAHALANSRRNVCRHAWKGDAASRFPTASFIYFIPLPGFLLFLLRAVAVPAGAWSTACCPVWAPRTYLMATRSLSFNQRTQEAPLRRSVRNLNRTCSRCLFFFPKCTSLYFLIPVKSWLRGLTRTMRSISDEGRLKPQETRPDQTRRKEERLGTAPTPLLFQKQARTHASLLLCFKD